MKFKVDYDALDTLDGKIYTQCEAWIAELNSLGSAAKVLIETGNISGNAADNIKNYLRGVHGTTIEALCRLIELHVGNFKIYKDAYQNNIDTNLHAIISSEELHDTEEDITITRQLLKNVEDGLSYTLGDVKDIFGIVYGDISPVDDTAQTASAYIKDVYEQIETLEAQQDFDSSEELISSLTSFIKEQLGRNGGTLTGFDINQLAASSSFANLYSSFNKVLRETEAQKNAVDIALQNDANRKAALEREEREKKATVINWVVVGVCVVGSVVAIAATGGAATPLVVAGVSAMTGAVQAGASNLTAQYVERGNLIENGVDWGSLGKDVVVGGVTGFVTGYVGAGIGGAANSLLNEARSIGSGVLIGSASQMFSGVVTRGAGTFTGELVESMLTGEEFDIAETWEKTKATAFDAKSVVLDGVTGGITGGVSTAKRLEKPEPLVDGPYIKDGKPNGRPKPTGEEYEDFLQKIYEEQVKNSPDGLLHDPNTGEIIDWKPGDSLDGVVDVGHKTGKEYRYDFERYKNREITLEELKEIQKDPSNFQLETPSSNRQHTYELKK